MIHTAYTRRKEKKSKAYIMFLKTFKKENNFEISQHQKPE